MEVRPVLLAAAQVVLSVHARGEDVLSIAGHLAFWDEAGLHVPRVVVDVTAVPEAEAVAESFRQHGLDLHRLGVAAPAHVCEADPEGCARLRREGVTIVATEVDSAATVRATPADALRAAPDANLSALCAAADDLGRWVIVPEVASAQQRRVAVACGVTEVSGPAVAPFVTPGMIGQSIASIRAHVDAPPARTTPPPPPPPAPPRRPRRRWLAWAGALVVLAAASVVSIVAATTMSGTADRVQRPVKGVGPLDRRGFNLTAWRDDDFNSRHARAALRTAAGLGANTVAVVVTQYVHDQHSSDIRPIAAKTPSDRSLRNVIAQAHRRGFYVSLKPHVDLVSGAWRGDLRPADAAAFAASYQRFILHYADLAAQTGAQELILGTELNGFTADASLIAAVRARFKGALGYAANWDAINRVPFWNDVDFIGVDAYVPLRGADVAQLVRAWQPYKRAAIALADRYRKPLVFTEAGYQSRAGATASPWGVPSGAPVDDAAQTEGLRALFLAWQNVPELRGIYLWQLYAGNPVDLDRGDWSVQGKPAERTVKQEFQRG